MLRKIKALPASELANLSDVHNEAEDLIATLRVDFSSEINRGIVAYLCEQVELCGTLIFLLGNEVDAGVASVFRTLLEAHINFLLLSADPSYAQYLRFEQASRSNNIVRRVKEKHSEESHSIVADCDKILETARAEIREAQQVDAKFALLEPYQKFDKAERSGLYAKVYAPLCTKVHSQLGYALNRHFEFDDETGKPSAVLYREFDPTAYETIASGSAAVLGESMEISRSRFAKTT